MDTTSLERQSHKQAMRMAREDSAFGRYAADWEKGAGNDNADQEIDGDIDVHMARDQ